MHTDQYSIGFREVSLNQREMVMFINIVGIDNCPEFASVLGRHTRFCSPVDKDILPQAIGDQIGDRRDLEPMFHRKFLEIGHPRHRPIIIHYLANDPSGGHARQSGQID